MSDVCTYLQPRRVRRTSPFTCKGGDVVYGSLMEYTYVRRRPYALTIPYPVPRFVLKATSTDLIQLSAIIQVLICVIQNIDRKIANFGRLIK